MKVFYSQDYVCSGHAFETTRKSQWVIESLRRDPMVDVEVLAPEPLTESQLFEVHDPSYVIAVRTGQPRSLAESQGFPWDPSLWRMVCASNGGAVAAALAALADGVAGSLSSGLHHARRGRGAGFCTFNGLALGIRAALDAGARSILILDLDAHCGGGTYSLVAENPHVWQLDIAVSSFDSYRPTGRCMLVPVREAHGYLVALKAGFDWLEAEAGRFDLCLYNAGMDPYEGCAIGGIHGITHAILEERERLVFGWCRQQRIPVAFVLAGGYLGAGLDERRLVALHRLTLSAAVRARMG